MAFVSAELAKSNDFFSALKPLFVPIAQDLNGSYFDPQVLKKELANRYGISVPEDVGQFLAGRLNGQGLLAVAAESTTGSFYRWQTPTGASGYDDAVVNDALEALVEKLVAFRNGRESLTFNEFGGGELLDILLDFLRGQEADVTRVEASLAGPVQPSVGDAGGKRFLYRDEKSYFCGQFVEFLAKESPDLHKWLSRLASAVLASEVILSLKEPPAKKLTLTGQAFYLDAPILMELLGCSGVAAQQNTSYTISHIASVGGSIRVFGHSFDEMRHAIQAVLQRETQKRFGQTHNALLRGETTEDYLRSVVENTDLHVKEAGVTIVAPNEMPASTAQKQAFSDAVAAELSGKLIGFYHSASTAEKDALSVTHVARARGFAKVARLSEARHSLLTRNDMLYGQVNQFMKKKGYLKAGELGPVVLMDQISSVVWLAVGDQEKIEIDTRRLLLHADRMAQSSPEAMTALRSRLQAVNSANAEQFDALMRVPRYYQLAMDLVGGSADRAHSVDPIQILERIRRETSAEKDKEHQARSQKQVERHRNEKALLKSALQNADDEAKKLAEQLKKRQDEDYDRALSIAHSLSDARFLWSTLGRVFGFVAALIWLVASVAALNHGSAQAEAKLFVELVKVLTGPILLGLGFFFGKDYFDRYVKKYWRDQLDRRLADSGLQHYTEEAVKVAGL